ncbi:MAG: META domain-containing protein [Chitinispirillaceae bacterium]|nr:META domain-containing protein [Chitinispirillaceae bacterium]
MNRIILLIALSSFFVLHGCFRSPLESKWQFIRVADERKMNRDFLEILSKISRSSADFMIGDGMIESRDSISFFSCTDTPEISFSVKPSFPFIFSRGAREFTGSLGCNNRFRTRFLSGSGKIFLKEIAMTTLPCDQCDKDFLYMYRQYLFAINGYRITGDTLVLKTLFSNDLSYRKSKR